MVPLDVVGLGEIAKLLGADRRTVEQWQRRKLLPPSEATVGNRPVWRTSTITRWAQREGYPRPRGRPAGG